MKKKRKKEKKAEAEAEAEPSREMEKLENSKKEEDVYLHSHNKEDRGDKKKDKGVVPWSPVANSSEEESNEKDRSSSSVRFSSRNPSSKYDFVKVSMFLLPLSISVWLI